MIFFQDSTFTPNKNEFSHYSYPRYDVYLKGVFYIKKCLAGKESLDKVMSVYQDKSRISFEDIFGNFIVCIVHKNSSKRLLFSDNSSMLKLYIAKQAVSTSFLEVSSLFSNDKTEKLIDYQSITEFLHFGHVYLGNTFLTDVKKVSEKKFIVIENNTIQQHNKNIPNSFDFQPIQIDGFFRRLFFSIKTKIISLDLTGGIDSRLIVSFFSKTKLQFELAISGIKNNLDIRIAKKIASILSRPLHITYHEVEKFSANQIIDAFNKTDAQLDVLAFHRNHQFSKDRISRAIDIQISGVGGELYKDFWWLQDFPFYNKKESNLSRLYHTRIAPTKFNENILGSKCLEVSKKIKPITLNVLNKYVCDSNSKTYDSIYLEYKMKINASNYVASLNNYFDTYAPLLEPGLLSMAFKLDRKTRTFNYFHRRWISKNHMVLSKEKTTENTSCSNRLSYIVFDIGLYLLDKIKRVGKLILRKTTNKTFFQESPNNNKMYEQAKKISFIPNMLIDLSEKEILKHHLTVDQLNATTLGRCITIYLFLNHISNFKITK